MTYVVITYKKTVFITHKQRFSVSTHSQLFSVTKNLFSLLLPIKTLFSVGTLKKAVNIFQKLHKNLQCPHSNFSIIYLWYFGVGKKKIFFTLMTCYYYITRKIK